MNFNLEDDIGGFLTESSKAFGGSIESLDMLAEDEFTKTAAEDAGEASEDSEIKLADEIAEVDTHRRALQMLEILKKATPIGKYTDNPGQARAGWRIEKVTDGWSIVNDVPYIGALIFGTAPHLIFPGGKFDSPFSTGSSPVLSFFDGGTTAFASYTKHPGSRPVAALRTAWNDAYLHGLVNPDLLRKELLEGLPSNGQL